MQAVADKGNRMGVKINDTEKLMSVPGQEKQGCRRGNILLPNKKSLCCSKGE